jgi:phage-related protein
MPWPVVYYRAIDASEPVNEAIDKLPAKVQVVIDNQIARLGLFGPELGYPYTSQIDGELRELRCHFGDDLFRILYQRSRNLFVLLSSRSERRPSRPRTLRLPRRVGSTSGSEWRSDREDVHAQPGVMLLDGGVIISDKLPANRRSGDERAATEREPDRYDERCCPSPTRRRQSRLSSRTDMARSVRSAREDGDSASDPVWVDPGGAGRANAHQRPSD